MKDAFMSLPWWVRWVVIPLLALAVFGGLLLDLIAFVVGLAFKILVFAVLVALVIFLVRKFSSSSGSSGSGGW
ncbi:hypothetical protein FNQ90_06035 [Streptomyces alkaliphilus]|uniref:DUF5326 family protein n=1 Tax=Streptomyces alkaliphilus TaxID=1472722 RepID=A0A7W3TBL9_9ACTN|nr:DUF5326 family protein [Streptomyces alkaliphilus]MBB0243680.1 hypothetical protein [Streptomyces alkaliphilus]